MTRMIALFVLTIAVAFPRIGEGASLRELAQIDGGDRPPPILVGDVTFDYFFARLQTDDDLYLPYDVEVTPLTDDPSRPGLLFEHLFFAEEHEGPDPWSIDEFSIISSTRITGLSLELVDYRFYDPESESLIEVSAGFTDYGIVGVEAELDAAATSTMLHNDFAAIDMPPERFLQMLGMDISLTVADAIPFELRSWALRVHLVPEPAGIVLAANCALGSAVLLLLRKRGARRSPASRPKASS